MKRFLDTSFLVSLYFVTNNSSKANEALDHEGQMLITPLVVFELENAIWLEAFRHRAGDRDRFSLSQAEVGLAAFKLQLEAGAYVVSTLGLPELLAEAQRLTLQHTIRHGLRSMDVLHLAAAKLLGCPEFLTFDKVQRRVAELEGFAVPL